MNSFRGQVVLYIGQTSQDTNVVSPGLQLAINLVKKMEGKIICYFTVFCIIKKRQSRGN